jgi:hypothetical protein
VAGVANGVGPISRDGEAALLFRAIDAGDRGAVVQGVKQIRAYLAAHPRPGLRSFVTGPGGIAADLEATAPKPPTTSSLPPSASSSSSCSSSTEPRSSPSSRCWL